MKKLLYAVFAAFVLASCAGNEAPQMSPIHVEGNHFVNSQGQTVVFRGLCLADPVKLINEGQWTETIFAQAQEWGANVVRFAVHPQNINAYGWEETFEAMDKGVEWAKAHDLYVIMDWHSIGNLKDEQFYKPMYITTIEETFRFWETVAQRYKDEPAVALYEIYNEPTFTCDEGMLGTEDWPAWKALQEKIIDSIRAINPSAVCLCAAYNWAYDLTVVADAPVERNNIAYVSHPYPMKRSEPWEEQWEADFGFVADTYPVICTEIGYCLAEERGAHIPVISTDVYGDHITRYFQEKGISFTVWCFDTGYAPTLISDWDYTPTTQGRYFKAYLQSQKQ